MTEAVTATQGYCVRCRGERPIQDEQRVVLKNGRPAAKGTCPECGTKLFRFLKPDPILASTGS